MPREWSKWLLAIGTAASIGIGGWYGKTVWSYEGRITRVETKVEGLHETMQDVKKLVERVDRRLERLVDRSR